MITLAGFVGTPDYASPEQLNEQDLDVTSDIYSLGVTLWFLLTGRPPFRGPMAQVMAQHLQSPPPFDEVSHLPTPRREPARAHAGERVPRDGRSRPTLLVEEIDACLASLNAGATARRCRTPSRDNGLRPASRFPSG